MDEVLPAQEQGTEFRSPASVTKLGARVRIFNLRAREAGTRGSLGLASQSSQMVNSTFSKSPVSNIKLESG